jgi:hypothetical protein
LDNGQTWSNPISLPSNISINALKSDPWMQFSNGIIYYSYLDYPDPTKANFQTQITMAKSLNNGETWLTTKAGNNTQFADKETFIVSDNGTIFLFYDDISRTTGLGEIKLSKSIDYVLSFSDMVQVNDFKDEDIASPYASLSLNQTIFVAWLKVNSSKNSFGDIYYDYSVNQGQSYNLDSDLNPETEFATYIPGTGKSSLPVLHFDSNDRLYAIWIEYNTNWKIYIRYSDDFGNHWSSKIGISENANVDQFLPDLEIDTNNMVQLVWYEEKNSQYKPYYRSISYIVNDRDTIEKSYILQIGMNLHPLYLQDQEIIVLSGLILIMFLILFGQMEDLENLIFIMLMELILLIKRQIHKVFQKIR